MQVKDSSFSQFKSYSDYISKDTSTTETKKPFNPKPILGAALGVGIASLACLKLKGIDEDKFQKLTSKLKDGENSSIYQFLNKHFKKNEDGILYKFMDLLHLKDGGKKTFKDVSELILTAASANAGAVLLNSKGKTKEEKKAKWKEAGFQIMNMAIPMLMTTASLKFCESKECLNKNATKIIGSIIGMTSGAALATTITNLGKSPENKRKYTLKDSIANFDDIIATIKIGFEEIDKMIPVSKILPFIYIYSGSRAGAFGDNKEVK